MVTSHRHPSLTLRSLSTAQLKVALGLAIAAIPRDGIEQIAPNAFGLTLRSGRPAAFEIVVTPDPEGRRTAEVGIGATFIDRADRSEALEIIEGLFSSLPVWCDHVWAMTGRTR
jgi:hypothetical protein